MGHDTFNTSPGDMVFNATTCAWEPIVLTPAQAERIRIHDAFLGMVRKSMKEMR
jgi:hypothetical protein